MLRVPMSEIANRLVALQTLLVQQDTDVAVIRQNADLYYFTGTVQDAHLIVPASGPPVYLVRRDVHRAEAQSPIRPVIPLATMKDLPEAVLQACGNTPPKRVGMELDVLPANTFFFYDQRIFPREEIVDVGGLIRQARMVKSPWEIEMMRGAGTISRAVADAVPTILQEGMSELRLSVELERVARTAGHLGIIRIRTFNMDMYFGHVLSGPEAALPSYADAPTGGPGTSPAFGQGPGNRQIRSGEIVSVDTMMNHHGYLNDQTRNFCLGAPPPKLAKGYRFIQEIHHRFRESAKPGMVTGELYAKVWGWVKETEFAEYFMGHGASRVSFIGHGLGLEADEYPFIAQGQKLELREGMTIAFEPKFIVPETGIVGLENTYVVTSRGLDSLNTASEELILL